MPLKAFCGSLEFSVDYSLSTWHVARAIHIWKMELWEQSSQERTHDFMAVLNLRVPGFWKLVAKVRSDPCLLALEDTVPL